MWVITGRLCWPPSSGQLRQIWIWLWGEAGSYWRIMRGGGPVRQNYGYDGWLGWAGCGLCSAQLCSGLTESLLLTTLSRAQRSPVPVCRPVSAAVWLGSRSSLLPGLSLLWTQYSYDMRSMCRTVVHPGTAHLCTHRAIWQLQAASSKLLLS